MSGPNADQMKMMTKMMKYVFPVMILLIGQKLSGGTCSVLVFESDNPDLLQHQICEDEEKDVGRKQKEAQSKSSESIT